ncbi:hypothetical protein DW788_08230 [Bifidobacterium longum]|nr:hypothetical protein DW788_08230 [Bifidobacterium longum]
MDARRHQRPGHAGRGIGDGRAQQDRCAEQSGRLVGEQRAQRFEAAPRAHGAQDDARGHGGIRADRQRAAGVGEPFRIRMADRGASGTAVRAHQPHAVGDGCRERRDQRGQLWHGVGPFIGSGRCRAVARGPGSRAPTSPETRNHRSSRRNRRRNGIRRRTGRNPSPKRSRRACTSTVAVPACSAPAPPQPLRPPPALSFPRRPWSSRRWRRSPCPWRR